MRNKSCKTLVLAVCAASIIIIAGCGPAPAAEAGLSGTKKARLIILENSRLQKEIETYKKLLAECSQRDEKLLQKEAKEEIQNFSQQALKNFEEIIKLREENEKLKSQIILLEDQLKQLKAEPK